MRGVSCQALSLTRSPVPWGGQPGFRDPCFPGAVGVGVGTQQRPHSVRPCEPSLRAMGVARGRPRGGALCRCEGRLSSGALPHSAARPLGWLSRSATHVLWARVCGRGTPALSLWLACPARGCVPRGWWEAVPGGVAIDLCERHLVSGAVPPPAARPLGGLSGSATHVHGRGCAGVGAQHCCFGLHAPVGGCVPRGWWEAVPGGWAFHRSEGHLVSGAVPLPAARSLGRAAGVPRPVVPGRSWCGRGDSAAAPQRALL